MLNYESGIVFRDDTFCSEFFGGFLKSFFKLSLYGIAQVSLSNNIILKIKKRDFPGGPVVQTLRPKQGARVRSPVRKQISHAMRHGQKVKIKKRVSRACRTQPVRASLTSPRPGKELLGGCGQGQFLWGQRERQTCFRSQGAGKAVSGLGSKAVWHSLWTWVTGPTFPKHPPRDRLAGSGQWAPCCCC